MTTASTIVVASTLLAVFLPAASIAVDVGTPTASAAASTAAPTASAALRARLPAAETLVEEAGALRWGRPGAQGFTVLDLDEHDDVHLDPGVHGLPMLVMARSVLAADHGALLDALPKLVANAAAAGIADPELRLAEGIMTGPQLRSPDHLVLVEGALAKRPAAAYDPKPDQEHLAAALAAVRADLAASKLGVLARASIETVLALLDQRDADARKAEDEPDPSFARRVIRYGWLRGLSAHADDLEQAVRRCESFHEQTVFAGDDGLRLRELRDAFGTGGWALETPTRVCYVHGHDPITYDQSAPPLNLVVELPAGSDAARDAAHARSARLYWGSRLLASWKAGSELEVTAAWRLALPEHPHGHDALIDGFAPPHLLIDGLDGDVALLITAHGVLEPPRNGSPDEARRFVADAAKVLPDAAHLDLIGEHLFTYVHDSPDSSLPFLIGNKHNLGDIHQTAEQTIATTTGGMFRGDCDDLAELYHDIAVRQGRLPHVIHLPSHAAAAWCEQREGRWRTVVLQTGPPLQFEAAELKDSLALAYRHFDPNRVANPDQVPVALRFAGENTRSTWVLSWRIFADPAYSATMIDVERDWYFHTYHHGIATMERLIAAGDTDPANSEELSGLHRRTGEWDKAIAYNQESSQLSKDPEAQLEYAISRVGLLVNAERFDEAGSAARALLEQRLPAMKASLGKKLPRLVRMVLGSLDAEHHGDLILSGLKTFIYPAVKAELPGVRSWADEHFDQRTWEDNRALREFRGLASEIVSVTLAQLNERGMRALDDDAELRELFGFSESWLNDFRFMPADERDAPLRAYATQGYLDGIVLGRDELRALVAAARYPADADHDHRQRVRGLAQLRLDLPWLRCSVPFWNAQLARDLWRQKPEHFDAALALRDFAPLADAYRECVRLGLTTPSIEAEAHHAELLRAMLARDLPALRAALAEVKRSNDRATVESAADTIGVLAPYLPHDWFGQVLDAWQSEVDYKPFWFAIAWSAAVAKGDAQALLAGERACARYPDDHDFAAELVMLRQVLKDRAAAAASAPTPAPTPAPAKP